MGAASQGGLDGRHLAKLMALLDSPVDAEAALSLHKIRMLLKKHNVTFYEAVEQPDYKAGIWENFGNPECLKDYFERGNASQLQEQITQLQAELAQREHDGARLAEGLNQAHRELEQLRRNAVAPRGSASHADPISGGLVAFVVLAVVVLMIAAACQ